MCGRGASTKNGGWTGRVPVWSLTGGRPASPSSSVAEPAGPTEKQSLHSTAIWRTRALPSDHLKQTTITIQGTWGQNTPPALHSGMVAWCFGLEVHVNLLSERLVRASPPVSRFSITLHFVKQLRTLWDVIACHRLLVEPLTVQRALKTEINSRKRLANAYSARKRAWYMYSTNDCIYRREPSMERA